MSILAKVFESGKFSDFTFVGKNFEVKAHKCVLNATGNERLIKLLHGNDAVILDCVCSDAVKICIGHIYEIKVPTDISLELHADCITLATAFDMPDLLKQLQAVSPKRPIDLFISDATDNLKPVYDDILKCGFEIALKSIIIVQGDPKPADKLVEKMVHDHQYSLAIAVIIMRNISTFGRDKLSPCSEFRMQTLRHQSIPAADLAFITRLPILKNMPILGLMFGTLADDKLTPMMKRIDEWVKRI